MKNNRPTRRISLLFARYYLAFTLVLLALFFGFYHLWDRLYVDLLHIPDPDALFQSREFRNGEYADIDTRTPCCALRILTPGILYPLCRLRPRMVSSAGS